VLSELWFEDKGEVHVWRLSGECWPYLWSMRVHEGHQMWVLCGESCGIGHRL